MLALMQKVCSGCGEVLPISAFHRRNHHVRSGHRAACKACARAYEQLRVRVRDRKKERIRARTKAALAKGLLTPGPCAWCGRPDDVEAHHPSYDGPMAHLEVKWLCQKHHHLVHGKRDWTRQLDLPLGEGIRDIQDQASELFPEPGTNHEKPSDSGVGLPFTLGKLA